MKKSIAIVLTLCMMLTLLAGCGGATPGAPASSTPPAAPSDGGTGGTALSGPVNLRFASSGSGGSDYADIGTILTFLSGDGILPAKSTLTQETISSGTSSSGYLIEAGMADVCRGQNAMAATVGFNGREPYKTEIGRAHV